MNDSSDSSKNDPYRIDAHKLQYHPERVVQWMKKHDSWDTAKNIYPIYVEISPVGACNHRCTFCAVDYIGYKPRRLETETLISALTEMAAVGVKSVMFAGEGEPLLHKDLDRIISRAYSLGLDIAITTNGTLLHKLENLHLCTWVKVSMNAGTAETYAKIHQTDEDDFFKVLFNLKDAVSRKGDCTLGAQMVLLPENEKEINQFEEACFKAGLDYAVVKPYSQHKFSITRKYENFQPVIQNHGGLTVRTESMKTTGIQYEKCHATPYLWAYVMASGDVYSCSAYLQDPRFNLGNINDQTFQQIWTGEKRQKNWEYVNSELDIRECRVNCRMDKCNRYLDGLLNGVPHENFI